MKKIFLALITLIIVGICIPAVSAEIIYDEDLIHLIDTSDSGHAIGFQEGSAKSYFQYIWFRNIENHTDLSYVAFDMPGANVHDLDENLIPEGEFPFTYTSEGITKSGVGYVSRSTNLLGQITQTKLIMFFYDWDVTGLSGSKEYMLDFRPGYLIRGLSKVGAAHAPVELGFYDNGVVRAIASNTWFDYSIASSIPWVNHLKVEKNTYGHSEMYQISLERIIDEKTYGSELNITKNDISVYYNNQYGVNVYPLFPTTDIDTVTVTNPHGIDYVFPLESGNDPDDPDAAMLRTGTVTMTDNNGTTISGFDVTAINHYTGEEYTVSTDTDVAVITLPMDRTTQMRDPWTGEYEESPVGYYRFYGQALGYKMLVEEGIQVSVLPEKYGSYELCDIRVTSESGYLSGKHLFQIRSRSDNSILQSGTISAKSATTDEWFNTSVSGGIASLILPYDTSNSQSQYAGNYYVYATSPGYEDSDFGTQIVVMPHTASEINDIYLTPIGGVPIPGNVTLRIQVFSETGPGVVNAEVFIAGVQGAGSSVWDTYTASSTGYLTVSVPGNSTYDIVASGTGYYDSARRVEVLTEDPPLIEIKLYLSGAPTIEPTTQPTGWVTPTPTQTTPIQEDNLIGLSVKGLAKGFGIDYDTALLMFGMMIIFGAGGIVMSSVNGGAMEFIAGSIVGTFVAFALGLIPIWIFIIIAVVFGAYVLRVFIQGGQ